MQIAKIEENLCWRAKRAQTVVDSVLLSNWSNNVCTLQQQRALSFLNQGRNQFQSTFCHVRCSCYPSTLLILLARMATAQFILHIVYRLLISTDCISVPRYQVEVLETCRSSWRRRRHILSVRLTNILHHWMYNFRCLESILASRNFFRRSQDTFLNVVIESIRLMRARARQRLSALI